MVAVARRGFLRREAVIVEKIRAKMKKSKKKVFTFFICHGIIQHA
jgi:hypothetical protein